MIVLAMEEFTSKRRTAQAEIEEALRPVVTRAMDRTQNTGGWSEVLVAVREQWREAYAAEFGSAPRRQVSARWVNDLARTLRKTKHKSTDEATVDRSVAWLATAILSNATETAVADSPEEFFLEWVDMDDEAVRPTHRKAAGQRRPVGEKFSVGGEEMSGPGDPTVDIKEWINCRCTLRPVPASESLVAALDPGALEEPTHAGVAVQAADTGRVLMIQRSMDPEDAPEVQGTWEFPGGTIEEGETPEAAAWREFSEETGLAPPEGETTNGWRSPDGIYQGYVFTVPVEEDAFEEINPDFEAAHIPNPDDPQRRRPDVTAWFTIDQMSNLGPALRPEVAKMDWSVFDQHEEAEMPEPETPDETPDFSTDEADAPLEQVSVEWHGVIAPEGIPSGDGRTFAPGALTFAPLPLPLTWQKTSADGHKGNVTVAKIERLERVAGEIRGGGAFLMNSEADEVEGLIAEFGRFGVSVDADSAAFEVDDEAQQVTFTAARARAACIVAIPAFAEAYVALGPAPEGFWDDGEDVEVEDVEEEVEESLVAADLAPGITEDGPGWLTHPVDTDRLRDYWVSGPGAAKIGWGTPGDFNRCRLNVAEYVKPQHLNGYCANRHFDALGFWPGQHHSAKDSLGLGDVGDVISLTASGGHCAPSEWFEDPKFSPDDGRMVWFDTGQVDDDGKPIGQWACPQTITEDGQIFGHVAGWKMCHSGWADQCILPPHSATGYAHFLLGEVLTDKGPVAVGNLTIGGGHAGPRASLRAAVEHYDSTSSVFADVAVGEDEFGIWFAGWIRPGTPPEMVHAARASKVSGDWRRNPSTSSLEMIAALAVNVPGYRIPRVAAGLQGEEQISLVAAGVVDSEPVIPKKVEAVGVDLPTLASLVAQEMTALQARKDKMLALSERVNGKGGA